MSDHSHPLFARFYERLSPLEERSGQGENRTKLLEGLSGRVVEVGAGNGLNFAYYPAAVTEVVAVEPEPYLRTQATRRAAEAPVTVRVVDGTAEALPLGDGEADAVVTSLVLCSVADQAVALTEARRVLRPGGELRFYEHVVSEKSGVAAFQRAVNPLWGRMMGGCHLDRDTGGAIERAGYEVERLERITFSGISHILGVARAPSG